jgi:hypothetical protein
MMEKRLGPADAAALSVQSEPAEILRISAFAADGLKSVIV